MQTASSRIWIQVTNFISIQILDEIVFYFELIPFEKHDSVSLPSYG